MAPATGTGFQLIHTQIRAEITQSTYLPAPIASIHLANLRVVAKPMAARALSLRIPQPRLLATSR